MSQQVRDAMVPEPGALDGSESATWVARHSSSVGFVGVDPYLVQGSVGTAVTYDHTYTVINAAPTFINFDYLGVDRVVFVGSPDYIFAVDDLTVTVPARAPVDAGRVQTVVHLSLQSNGDMTVTFAGTLQSASDIDGPFEDVPGNPQGTYTIPKANLTTHRYFRAKGD